jgi:predicted nucleic acid-binding protein
VIVIDASVWVSYLIPRDVHHDTSVIWLRRWRDDRRELLAPVLLLAEVAGAVARRFDDQELGDEAKRSVLDLPDLRLIAIDQTGGDVAADIASRLRLRGADAIYVALAQEFDLPLVTWDDEIVKRAASVVSAFTPAPAPN